MSRKNSIALGQALANARFEVIPIGGSDAEIARLPRKTKVTVTCSPTRGVDHTLDYIESLVPHGFELVPHISARLVRDPAHVQRILERLSGLDVREVFVVGGDSKHPVGPYSSAIELLRAMVDHGHRLERIGVSAYPEHHPFIDDRTLRRSLFEKQAFASYMVTQICFDPAIIGRWLLDARANDVHLPVYIGLPGIVDKAHLMRISMKIGVGTSTRFLAKNAGLAARLLMPGSYRPTELLEGLAPYFDDPRIGIEGIHINTFNQVARSEQWRQEMLVSAGDDRGGWRRSGRHE